MVRLGVGQVFADYTIDGILGQGGMGSVYLARHPRLPRQVALKLLAPEVSADDALRRRFDQEANAIARLDHPNIVGIHDRGVHEGQLWIAMQYIQGTDTSRLDPRQVRVTRAVRIITETAAALDYAHSRGILHRDVKPANILLAAPDTAREERAILTDFGIARLLDAATEITSTGMVTATLAYASPEQLSGDRVDHRSDQYSLACTLFALLTGQSPFAGTTPGQVITSHLTKPFPKVSSIRLDSSALLDAVLARAAAKRPEDRYVSCTEFASAAAFVVNQPAPSAVLTPNVQPSPFELSPSVGPLSSADIQPIAAVPAPSMPTPWNPEPSTFGRRKLLRFTAVAAPLVAAGAATAFVLTDNGGGGRPSQPNGSESANDINLSGHAAVHGLAYTPDGIWLASVEGPPGMVRLWDMRTNSQAVSFKVADDVVGMVLSPDGKTLVTGYRSQFCEFWDPRTGQQIGDRLQASDHAMTTLTGSADGSLLAVAGDGGVNFWDMQTRQQARDPIPTTDRVFTVAFAPDNATIAIGGDFRDGVILYDLVSRRQTAQLGAPDRMVVDAVRFSPDGRTLAVGDRGGTVRLWDTTSHQLLGELLAGRWSEVTSLVFTPDGRSLISGQGGGGDTPIQLWDVAGRSQRYPLSGDNQGANALAFSPDATKLASGSPYGIIRLWDMLQRK